MMKKIIPLFTTLLLLGWSMNAWSFACKTATGATIPIGGGSANVYVNLTPAVNVGQNLVVDLSTQIFCHNDYPETITDYVTLQRGSAYGGVLSSFSGTVKYNGTSYPFPTTTETARVIYDSRTDKPWPAVLYLTPVSTAGGVAITAGSLIAVLILHQTNNYNSDSFQFIWNIYANNDVVVPTGGCVAQLYFAMQATFQKIALLQELEGIARFSVEAHEHRTRRGLEDSVDVANAQAEQLAARQQIISAEGMLTQYRETLRALIGADAQSMPAIHPVALPALQETLPPSLSFELLARRPDLQALRGYVTASLSQVDAAKAAFYPHFDIKAFWGYNALSVGDLFKSSFQQINLLPGLYLPIFDGGRLNANLQSVRTASNILIKQYNQAVLDAVRDVAISSSQLNDLNQQRALQQLKVTAAQTTTDSARAHYQRGLLSRYAAEEARRAVLAQQLLLLDIETQRLSTDITLIKALGGGYRGQ